MTILQPIRFFIASLLFLNGYGWHGKHLFIPMKYEAYMGL
jgi:hypothetical protein